MAPRDLRVMAHAVLYIFKPGKEKLTIPTDRNHDIGTVMVDSNRQARFLQEHNLMYVGVNLWKAIMP